MKSKANFEIYTTPDFEKELKRLAKRYRSVKADYSTVDVAIVQAKIRELGL